MIVKQKMKPKYGIKYLHFLFYYLISLQKIAVDILRNLTIATPTDIANALSLYINSLTDSNSSPNPDETLTPKEVDDIVGNLTGSFTKNTSESFIMVQQLNQGENITVLGASFKRDIGGNIVKNTKDEIINSNISVGALISDQSLEGATSLNMLIIDKPISYAKLDNSDHKKLVSSVIVVALQRNRSSTNLPYISLYFRVLNEYQPLDNAMYSYSCSFYDMDASKWNDSADCTKPIYNTMFKRYECNCSHLSTFALVGSPCDTDTEVLDNGICKSKTVAQV